MGRDTASLLRKTRTEEKKEKGRRKRGSVGGLLREAEDVRVGISEEREAAGGSWLPHRRNSLGS